MARSVSSKTRPRAASARSVKPLPKVKWPIPAGCGQVYVDKVHENDKATPETAHLFGSAEPRISTPPLRELTPETSLGFEVIDFADEVLGINLLPWQRGALIRMLELNEDDSLRFSTVLVLVARQNGKSTLAQVLTIWLLLIWGWPLILGTAQDLDVAESLWEEVVDLVHDDEELAGLIENVTRTNGKKSLNLLSGGKYKVKAANRRAGRGLSGNLILLDELREHQTWDAWGAITKTTMARAESLILALSNAGDVTSRVLRYLRLLAHKALGDPDGIAAADEPVDAGPTEYDIELADTLANDEELDEFDVEDLDLDLNDLEQDEDSLCILEWSAPPGCALRDRAGWSWANPSRNYTISDRKIAAALRTDPEWVFRTEVLCQWNDGATSGPFTPGAWEATTVETKLNDSGQKVVAYPQRDTIVGKYAVGIAQSNNRELTHIALAGYRPDGAIQIEMIPPRYGIDWVEEWLTAEKRRAKILAATGQEKGAPESTLLKKLRGNRKVTSTVSMPVLAGSDLLDAYAEAEDAIRDKQAWHPPHPGLDLAAATAEWKQLAGGQRVLDPVKSPVDIASLRAWIHSLWLLRHLPAAPPPPAPEPMTLDDLEPASRFDPYDADGFDDPLGDLSDIF